MKPYIICHMESTIDGRIDCDMLEQIDASDEYYDILEKLDCPSHLMGRVTMQMHYADSTPFEATDATPIGKQAWHIAKLSNGYTIAIDTFGKLRWPSFCYDGKPLLVITSESCSKEYLSTLTAQGISWIATGSEKIDLEAAMTILNENFGVKRLAVIGGGRINGAFLAAGLLDEVSVMVVAGIDGRAGMTVVFDGIDLPDRTPTRLTLDNVYRISDDTVWLRYRFK